MKKTTTSRIVSWETLALCVGNAAGAATFSIQPLWIAAFSKSGLLTRSQLGWIASGELFFIAVSGLLVASRGNISNPRRLAMVAALLIAVANTVAMYPAAPALIIGKLLSGLGMGALFATITRVAARRIDSQRVLALMQAATMAAVSVVYLTSPVLVGHNHPAGVFGLVAILAATAAIAARFGLPELATRNEQTSKLVGPMNRGAVLGCVALACVGIGVATINTYVVIIGNSLAFSPTTIAKVMAAIGPIAMIGPITAHVIGERAKLLPPIIFALTLMLIDVFFLSRATSPLELSLTVSFLNMGSTFCLPFAIAIVGHLDMSGRLASAAPIAVLLGASVGPKLGSELLGGVHSQALLGTASESCLSVGLTLFVMLGIMTTRRNIGVVI